MQKTARKLAIDFGFASHWLKSSSSLGGQLLGSEAIKNQSKAIGHIRILGIENGSISLQEPPLHARSSSIPRIRIWPIYFQLTYEVLFNGC